MTHRSVTEMSAGKQFVKVSCCFFAWLLLMIEANGQAKFERFNEITKDSFKSQFDKIEKELHNFWREPPESKEVQPGTPKANPIDVCKLNPNLPQCKEIDQFFDR